MLFREGWEATDRHIWGILHWITATAAACPTLCDPIDGSPPGSPVPGILQARTLEWVAISFSNAWKWKVKVKLLSRVWLLATPWTAAYHASLSMGFSRQEYWSGVPLPSPVFIYSFLTWNTSLCKFTHQDPVGGKFEPLAMDHFKIGTNWSLPTT